MTPEALLEIDDLFRYANIMLVAFAPVVILALGFALGVHVIRFIQIFFSRLRG